MKKFKFLAFALFAVLACVSFASCSDDDKDEAVNPHTGYPTKVEVKDASKCVVTVYEPNSTTIYQRDECTYTYDSKTGAFSVRFDDYNVIGFIKGDTMTLTDNRYGTFDLKRVK